MFRHTKPLADLLTLARALLAFCIAGLSLVEGTNTVALAVVGVIVSWLTDLLDGPLARHDPDPETTWIGEHDAEADLSTSLGVTVYLVLSGHLPGWVGAILVLITLGLWILHSHQLAWPFYAVPYVLLGLFAFQEAPLFGWLAVGYLAIALAIRRRRLWGEFLPAFFEAVRSLRNGREQPADHTINGQP